jgi:23S rRNA-/tRNA-specific pseudouridylate synthase
MSLHPTSHCDESCCEQSKDSISILQLENSNVFVRRVNPYVHKYVCHVKARWIGRSIFDIYCHEFGGYSKEYFQRAIQSGTILLSNKCVSPNHILQNGQDILSHTVHLHEPPVFLLDQPSVIIVSETPDIVVVDKPPSMMVHPTGACRFNSLLSILESQLSNTNENKRKLYTIHRLDRVTTGICVFAKSSQAAQKLRIDSTSAQNRVHKWYLARVHGKFSCQTSKRLPQISMPHEIMDGVDCSPRLENSSDIRSQNAYGYWMIPKLMSTLMNSPDMTILPDIDSAQEFRRRSLDDWLHNTTDESWYHVACPTRVISPQECTSSAGTFPNLPDDVYRTTVKPAQTAFGFVSYCSKTNTSLLVCKPATGRSHQIRVHLQLVGHPIVGDILYGGSSIHHTLDVLDDVIPKEPFSPTDIESIRKDSLNTNSTWERLEGEILDDYVVRTCEVCQRNHDDDLVVPNQWKCSQICLRAIKYQILKGLLLPQESLSFQVKLPSWA